MHYIWRCIYVYDTCRCYIWRCIYVMCNAYIICIAMYVTYDDICNTYALHIAMYICKAYIICAIILYARLQIYIANMYICKAYIICAIHIYESYVMHILYGQYVYSSHVITYIYISLYVMHMLHDCIRDTCRAIQTVSFNNLIHIDSCNCIHIYVYVIIESCNYIHIYIAICDAYITWLYTRYMQSDTNSVS